MKRLGEILSKTADVDISEVRSGQDVEAPPEASPACPICKGAGFVRRALPVDHPKFGRAEPSCPRQLAQLVERLVIELELDDVATGEIGGNLDVDRLPFVRILFRAVGVPELSLFFDGIERREPARSLPGPGHLHHLYRLRYARRSLSSASLAVTT